MKISRTVLTVGVALALTVTACGGTDTTLEDRASALQTASIAMADVALTEGQAITLLGYPLDYCEQMSGTTDALGIAPLMDSFARWGQDEGLTDEQIGSLAAVTVSIACDVS